MRRIRRLFDALQGDDMERFRLLRRAARWLLPNYRLTWPDLTWWSDEDFNAYLRRFGELDGLNTHRRWNLAQLMRLVDGIPGDTAECGVFHGAGSFLMASVNLRSAQVRCHLLFDSFEGLSAPGAADGYHWAAGDLSVSRSLVERNLLGVPGIEIHEGWIPDAFSGCEQRRFAFVHIDVDLHDPTRDSLAFFYPRMSRGGVILCDDYGLDTCPGATRAVDEFFADKPEAAVSLSTGSCFIMVGCPTQRSIRA